MGQVFAASYSSFRRGVVKSWHLSLGCVKDSQSRYVIVKGILAGKEETFMNLDCPPTCSPDFLSKTLAVFWTGSQGLLAGGVVTLITLVVTPFKASEVAYYYLPQYWIF